MLTDDASDASEVPVAAAAPERPEVSTPRAESEPAPEPEPDRPPPEPHSLEVRNPATGIVVRTVAVTEASEVTQKLERARRAQVAWAARSYDDRAATLQAFRDLLAAEVDECAHVTTQEMGKPIRQSRSEVRDALERVDWNIANVGRVIGPRTVTNGDVEERITSEPIGVVAHISAWNYPYFVGLNTIVPALLAGNAVLYKPSEHATLTGLRIVDLLHRAGVPVDVVHAVIGAGGTGAALVSSGVDMVCFTGSHATGQRVLRAAADQMIRVQLELGGKDAAYVADDVDVEGAALDVAEGAFYNAGQSCSATERVVCPPVHLGSVRRRVRRGGERLRGGGSRSGRHRRRPTRRGREQLEVLTSQVNDATAKGARVLVGGHQLEQPGNWFAPTVVVDVDDRMALMRDESFGPVIGLAMVADDAEAVARMDDTSYGLGASVFTRDVRARRADPPEARRGQRVLEHGGSLDRAPPVGGPAQLRPGRVGFGVRHPQLRPREGLAPRPPLSAVAFSGGIRPGRAVGAHRVVENLGLHVEAHRRAALDVVGGPLRHSGRVRVARLRERDPRRVHRVGDALALGRVAREHHRAVQRVEHERDLRARGDAFRMPPNTGVSHVKRYIQTGPCASCASASRIAGMRNTASVPISVHRSSAVSSARRLR